MIFVRVREKHRFEPRRVLEDVAHIGNDHVDAEGRRVGEHHSAVDDNRRVTVLEDHQVHSDFAEAAERDDAERVARLPGCPVAVDASH